MAGDPCILGLHVTGDQSAASLLKGGRLAAAVAEERLTRQKRSRAFPSRAIDWCLSQAGLQDLGDADHIVVPWNPAVHMQAINMSGFTQWRRYDPEWLYIVPNNTIGDMPYDGQAEMTQSLGAARDKFIYLTHHQAHMGWVYASGFERAAIAVLDEYGERSSITFATCQGNAVTPLHQVDFPHSFGVYFATFTAYLGFRPNSDEWKVMGASAYGDASRFADKLRALISWNDGDLRLDQNRFEFANTRFGGYFTQTLIDHMDLPPRTGDGPLEQVHYDLAAAIQQVYEEYLFKALTWLHEKTGETNLVLNGGCAMNSLANGKILENTPFEAIYIGPAAADNGCAIGGALWVQAQRYAGNSTWRTDINAYSGPSFTDDAIREALERYKLTFEKPDDIITATTDLLEQGNVVGWMQGRMEFGERALGARSILADPRRADMKDRVNASVKYREAFRPFAPSVLYDHAQTYFDMPEGAVVNFMEQVYQVREAKRAEIPAVVHNDGTGRLQTVSREHNAIYHRLIKSFHDRTGVPVVLNTSFNLNGEPIVCSPDDALRTYTCSGLDALVMGSYLLRKAPAA
jgi:carbamoyltransferase